MIRSVTSLRQAPRTTAPQSAGEVARQASPRTAAPRGASAAPAQLTPQQYRDDVMRIGGALAGAVEQLRTARLQPGSAQHHQAVLRFEEAHAQLEALKRIETPVNWKWLHNTEKCFKEHIPALPDWALGELKGQTAQPKSPAKRGTGLFTGELRSAADGLAKVQGLVKQQAGVERVDAALKKVVATANEQEALAVFDAIEGFPGAYRGRLEGVRKAALEQAIKGAGPDSAPAIRTRIDKLHPGSVRHEAVRELEHLLMGRIASHLKTVPDALKLAAKTSWEVDRLKGTATVNVALERGRKLARGAGDAIAIFDAIEALPFPFDQGRLAGEKRKTLALGQTLPASPAEAAGLKDRQKRVPLESKA